ncbi:WecB/TagA/CpsF family glycosyltransferase [Arthrobacter sp. G119Y2]|uniref:WecB/TagA/CpsF family glycosyltransferase n=1 Tax=Arthrobacter sp. G119Y2 TaxID=3134965 RepID=UPI00311985CB
MTTTGVPTIRVVEGVASLDGLDFFSGDLDELKERVGALLSSGGVHLIVTTNTDQIIDFGKSKGLSEAYNLASLRLVDGKPLQSLVRALGGRNTERITGADLLPQAADWSREEKWRIAIIGGSDYVGEGAARNLRTLYPGSHVEHIPFPHTNNVKNENSGIVREQLHYYRPDISFVCLGSPKQEEWVVENMDNLPDGIYVGAGAAVDFAAGAKSRAPLLMQRMGLEWTWRLVQEPRRLWRRYLVKGSAFFFVIIKSMWGKLK